MTTIATDGITIAADGLCTDGNGSKYNQDEVKLIKDGNAIFGLSGTTCLMPHLIDWYIKGCKLEGLPRVDNEFHWHLLVITLNNPIKYFSNGCPYPDIFTDKYITIGTGAQYAKGAMMAGATPKKAVEIAAKCNVYTGGKIKVFNIKKELTVNKPKLKVNNYAFNKAMV